jgi:hypothetical protein
VTGDYRLLTDGFDPALDGSCHATLGHDVIHHIIGHQAAITLINNDIPASQRAETNM